MAVILHKVEILSSLVVNKATILMVFYFVMQKILSAITVFSQLCTELVPVVNVFVGVATIIYTAEKIIYFFKNKKDKPE